MNSNFLYSLPILGCLAFISCYPLPDRPFGPRGPKQQPDSTSVSSQEQQEIQKKRDEMKKRDAEKKDTAGNEIKKKPENEDTTTTKPKGDEKKPDYAFANAVPGKEGFVFSPYNNKLVDVRDIPSGTLVQDPTYPASEKKYFRVP